VIYVHGRDGYVVKVLSCKGRVVLDKCGLVTLQGEVLYMGFEKVRADVFFDEFYAADVVKGGF